MISFLIIPHTERSRAHCVSRGKCLFRVGAAESLCAGTPLRVLVICAFCVMTSLHPTAVETHAPQARKAVWQCKMVESLRWLKADKPEEDLYIKGIPLTGRPKIQSPPKAFHTYFPLSTPRPFAPSRSSRLCNEFHILSSSPSASYPCAPTPISPR